MKPAAAAWAQAESQPQETNITINIAAIAATKAPGAERTGIAGAGRSAGSGESTITRTTRR